MGGPKGQGRRWLAAECLLLEQHPLSHKETGYMDMASVSFCMHFPVSRYALGLLCLYTSRGFENPSLGALAGSGAGSSHVPALHFVVALGLGRCWVSAVLVLLCVGCSEGFCS